MSPYDEILSALKDDICYKLCLAVSDLIGKWDDVEKQEKLQEILEVHDKLIDIMIFLDEEEENELSEKKAFQP